MKKPLPSLFLLVFLVIGLSFANTAILSVSNASENVKGVITSDTTWTKANSPYNLTGDVLVLEGVALTIEPGVSINFNSYFMDVSGRLTARGTENEKIIMNGSGISYPGEWKGRISFLSTSMGSVMEYVEITSTPNIVVGVASSSPTISHCKIIGVRSGSSSSGSVFVDGGSPNIINNVISMVNGDGILLDVTSPNTPGSPIIADNILENNSVAVEVFHGAPLIVRNNITHNNEGVSNRGFLLTDSANISNNIISNNVYGIYFPFFSVGSRFNITKNLILNNDYGIVIQPVTNNRRGVGNITDNTISKNTEGIVVIGNGELTINKNNIQENANYNVRISDTSSNVNATMNWWGTINPQAINLTIYDFYDDFRLGRALTEPILDSPNPAAPKIPVFTITASAGPNGSISPTGNVSVSYGSSQTFNVTADLGYQMASVLVDGKPANAPYTFNNVVADGHTISAMFELIPVVPENFPFWTILAVLVMATIAVTVGVKRTSKTKSLN